MGVINPPPPYPVKITTQTGSYTLAATDAGSYIEMTSASALTLTVPPNSSVGFSIGTEIAFGQHGAGALSVVAGSGVTIDRLSTLNMVGQYATAALLKVGTNEWILSGALQ
ncbi:MAG: hypothetical protein WCD70_14175 [Alphaproteobacteria bacterium]